METTVCNLCALEVKQEELEIHNKIIHSHDLEWIPNTNATGDSENDLFSKF